MAAYLVARTRVTDPEAYGRYTAATAPLLKAHGGVLRVASNSFEVLEGDEDREWVVLIEFDSPQAARDFYGSPEYQAAPALSAGAAETTVLIVPGR